MIFHPTIFSDAWLIELKPIADERGWFVRTFCQQTFRERGLKTDFLQSNHSQCVRAGTLRGLHFQIPPATEAKLVRCVRGSIFDVLVDVRCGSPSFLQWHGQILTDRNNHMLYVPEGFAHGYQAIEAGSEVVYQASAAYAPSLERCIRFDDPRLGIEWPIRQAILSPKDEMTPFLELGFVGIDL